MAFDMLPNVSWLHVIAAAAVGLAVSMIFYFLPIMQRYRAEHAAHSGINSDSLTSTILQRILNTLIYAFVLGWLLNLTGISTLGMGLLLILVIMLRHVIAQDKWDKEFADQPKIIAFLNILREVLMYVAMISVLILWK